EGRAAAEEGLSRPAADGGERHRLSGTVYDHPAHDAAPDQANRADIGGLAGRNLDVGKDRRLEARGLDLQHVRTFREVLDREAAVGGRLRLPGAPAAPTLFAR